MPQQHFGKEYGGNASENYERFFVPQIGAPLASDLIDQVKPRTGDRILDVACGTGIVARMASERLGDTGYVAGLDINEGMLEVARRVSTKSIDWYQSSAEEIPLPENSFDLVLCQISLMFIPDKIKALREMQRVLSPGGRLFFTAPGPASPVFEALAETLGEEISPKAGGFVRLVFSLYDHGEVQQLLQDAGFKKIVIKKYTKTFRLPSSKDFLWQYIRSTPLLMMIINADENKLQRLEDKIVSRWKDYEKEDILTDHLDIMVASAWKS